jgi:hypothetical protein
VQPVPPRRTFVSVEVTKYLIAFCRLKGEFTYSFLSWRKPWSLQFLYVGHQIHLVFFSEATYSKNIHLCKLFGHKSYYKSCNIITYVINIIYIYIYKCYSLWGPVPCVDASFFSTRRFRILYGIQYSCKTETIHVSCVYVFHGKLYPILTPVFSVRGPSIGSRHFLYKNEQCNKSLN